MNVKETVKEFFDKNENASRREWMLLRCELQNPPTDEGELNKDAGEKLLNDFFSVYEEDTKDSVEKERFDKKALNSAFQSFLSENEPVEDGWGKNQRCAKNAISYISDYRDTGVLDTNIVDEVLTHAKFINNDPLRYIYELIQNADDCEYDAENPEMKIEISPESMTVSYTEKGMTCSDILAITTIGESNKGKKKKKKQIIGEKGRGFKTIFSVCSSVDIYSGFYHFTLTGNSFCPTWIEKPDIELEDGGRYNGTKMILHFRDEIIEKKEETDDSGAKITTEIRNKNFMKNEKIFDSIIEKYGVKDGKISYGDMLQSCPIVFTKNIRMLLIRKKDSSKILSIETKFGNNDNDGEISIVYKWTDEGGVVSEYPMECLRVKKETVFDYEEYNSRYKDIFTEEEYNKELENNSKVICYESVAVVPLKAEENKDIQGKLYSYLPTDINLRAPIAFHIPFELNEDRSCMYIEGMLGNPHDNADYCDEISGNRTTKWNHKLFEAAFCHSDTNKCLLQLTYEAIKEKFKTAERFLEYLPNYTQEKTFFVSGKAVDRKGTAQDEADQINGFCKSLSKIEKEDVIYDCIKKLKLFRSLCNKDNWLSMDDGPIMFDSPVTEIVCSTANGKNGESGDKKIQKLLECVSGNLPGGLGQDTLSLKDRLIPFLGHDRLKNLDLNMITIDDRNKTAFTNALLDMDYDAVMDELFKLENRSSYLSDPKFDKELRIIWMDDPQQEGNRRRRSIGNSVVWVEGDEKLAAQYPDNEDIAVFVPEWNPKLKLSEHSELNIRFVGGNEKTEELLKNIWVVWQKDKVKDTQINEGSFQVRHDHKSFSFEQFQRLMDLFRCICKSDKDWYSFMIECFLNKDNYPSICEEIGTAWEKEIGTARVHQKKQPSFKKCAYESIRADAQKLDKKEAEE